MTSRVPPRPVVGVYDEPYWAFVDACELRVQRCDDCGWLRYPPAPICPRCLADRHEWRRLEGHGRVLAWTTFHRQYFPQLAPPYTIVAVRTLEGPTLVGGLVNADGRTPDIGLPVRATFERVSDEQGEWRICQWEPATPGDP